jgi:AraC-like DNA-binding protein
MHKLMHFAQANAHDPLRVISHVLRSVVEGLPLKRCELAIGQAPPPQAATQTFSPRIVICLSGRDEMYIPRQSGSSLIVLRGNEAVYVSPAAWNLVLHRCAFSFLTLDFKPQHIRYYFRVSLGKTDAKPIVSALYFRSGPAAPASLQLLRALELCHWFTDQRSAASIVNTLIRESLGELLRRSAPEPSRSQAVWLTLRQHIEDHLDQPLTRTAVSKVIGVHPNHVSRLFRSYGKTGFSEYLAARRLERAAQLLTKYELTVKEISLRCGFSDASYFCRLFQRRMATSPGRYRAKMLRRSRKD